jgi:peptidoglycan/LPS O-acetylase OafA/YrhL
MNSATHALPDAIERTERFTPLTQVSAHEHVPPLDGIRGLAVLFVMVGHFFKSVFGEWGIWFSGIQVIHVGWVGVDLFFVLSGFLITGILYEAKGGNHFFRNFYARRTLRIFPLYYLALATVLLLAVTLPQLGVWGDLNPAWMWAYLTNYALAANPDSSFGVVDHFWSLAVEEHFYLVWPTIVFFFNRRALMIIAACLLVIAPILRFLSLEDGEITVATYMLTHARMDSLAAGALIALAVRGPQGLAPFVKPSFYVLPITAVIFLSIAIARKDFSNNDVYLGTIGPTLLWAGFGAALILSLTWRPAWTFTSAPVLRWFGKYSYGLYVWHPIVWMLIFHSSFSRELRLGQRMIDLPVTAAIAVAAALAVSLISWHLWEKQFLKLKGRFA